MKFDIYVFEYSTKTCSYKRISYLAYSFSSAWKRFRKNTRFTRLIQVSKNYDVLCLPI